VGASNNSRVYDSPDIRHSQDVEKVALLTRPTPAATSPARPESAKTASSPRDAPFPMRVLDTREVYLVKRRSFPNSIGRFTFYVSPFTNDKDGLFEHPARCAPVDLDVRTIEFPPCHNSIPQPARRDAASVGGIRCAESG
jgi:hypothetical protein